MRILIAEDDNLLADGLSRSLQQAGYQVDAVADGLAARAALANLPYDLLILDLDLPRLSGLDVLRHLRQRNSRLPVMILTAADTIEQRVQGLDLGADDYMAKPFALSELEARVRALIRRNPMPPQATALLRHGPLAFDPISRTATLAGQPLELSVREASLLEILLNAPNRLIGKHQIVDALCQGDDAVSLNAVEVYMHRLRRKIEPCGVRILTLRGLGYCLAPATEPGSSAP